MARAIVRDGRHNPRPDSINGESKSSDKYVDDLSTLLKSRSNQSLAGPMAAYMKNRFPFFGIKSPARAELVRDFVNQHGLPSNEDLEHVARALWDKPERECQYAALDLIGRSQKNLTPDAARWFEYLILTNAWWDTCDAFPSPIIAKLFLKYPRAGAHWIERWRASDVFWLRRTALLYQRAYKNQTDVALLFSLVEENLQSNEFFIQKAIGWALREHSKTDSDVVKKFVSETTLAPLSRREALKWIARKSAG